MACMADRSSYRILVVRSEGKGHLQDLGVDGTTVLKWMFKKCDGEACTSLAVQDDHSWSKQWISIPWVSTPLQTGGIEYCQVFGDTSLHSKVYALILKLYFNFNLNKYSNSNHQLTVIKL